MYFLRRKDQAGMIVALNWGFLNSEFFSCETKQTLCVCVWYAPGLLAMPPDPHSCTGGARRSNANAKLMLLAVLGVITSFVSDLGTSCLLSASMSGRRQAAWLAWSTVQDSAVLRGNF